MNKNKYEYIYNVNKNRRNSSRSVYIHTPYCNSALMMIQLNKHHTFFKVIAARASTSYLLASEFLSLASAASFSLLCRSSLSFRVLALVSLARSAASFRPLRAWSYAFRLPATHKKAAAVTICWKYWKFCMQSYFPLVNILNYFLYIYSKYIHKTLFLNTYITQTDEPKIIKSLRKKCSKTQNN